MCGRAPQDVVMLHEMPGKEQIASKQCGIPGQVAHWDVEVAALFQHGLQDQRHVEIVLHHAPGTHSLPVQHSIQVITATKPSPSWCHDNYTRVEQSWQITWLTGSSHMMHTFLLFRSGSDNLFSCSLFFFCVTRFLVTLPKSALLTHRWRVQALVGSQPDLAWRLSGAGSLHTTQVMVSWWGSGKRLLMMSNISRTLTLRSEVFLHSVVTNLLETVQRQKLGLFSHLCKPPGGAACGGRPAWCLSPHEYQKCGCPLAAIPLLHHC